MPEIKIETPKPEAQFELPKRRGIAKYLIVPIILLVALACVGAGYYYFTKPISVVVPEEKPVQEEEVKVKAGASFYLTMDSEGDSAVDKAVRLYQYSQDSSEEDKQILEIKEKNFSVIGEMGDFRYIVNSENKISLLDASKGKIDLLFELAENPLIRDVAVSEDKQWLAYARNYEGNEANGKSGGSIWLYNFETKEQKEIVKKTELGVYQGFSINGWRNSDKELIVSGLGGDAGAVWGDIYQVNIATGELVKVNPVVEKDKMDFLRGDLSPDGNKWVYSHCEQPDVASREKDNYGACTSGAELRVYDFGTKEVKPIYQNLRYDNNEDKSVLRTFGEYKWEDDNNIIAVVPGAILDISSGTKKVEEVYLFDLYDPMAFKNRYMSLMDVSEDQVVFYRDDAWQVFDRASQKLVNIDKKKQKETLLHWLN